MSLLYWISKFSHELIALELFLIAILGTSYFGYLLLKKRRYGVAKKQIPDNVVRAFLMELISYSEGFKTQLFGDQFKITPHSGTGPQLNLGAADAAAPAAAPAGDSAESAALRTQVATLTTKTNELAKIITTLTQEKAALEAKAAAAPAAPAAGGDQKAVQEAQDKISKLEAKLAEYEVIEDDLANLKRYQQENKQLKAQLEAMKGGAPAGAAPAPIAAAPATAPTPAPVAAAAAPEAAIAAAPPAAASPLAAAEETVATKTAEQDLASLTTKADEAPPTPTPVGASATDPATIAQAQTAPPAADTPAPAAEGGALAAGEPKQEKSDADLLNEFERMLSS